MSIIENYNIIREKISGIAESAGRDPDEIKIIAVSKTFPADIIQKAIESGITVFGENKVQEAKNKIDFLKGNFSFQMIGHLQSNKAKDAVKLFDIIHSIDKESTALKINNEAEKINKIQSVLIQVNSSGETSKSGIEPEKTLNLLEKIAELKNMDILGLMTMAPFTDNNKIIQNCFKITKNLLDEINSKLNLNLSELSMGMSSDYRIAIEEGATMLRIGTAIFGNRNYS